MSNVTERNVKSIAATLNVFYVAIHFPKNAREIEIITVDVDFTWYVCLPVLYIQVATRLVM